MLRLFLSSLFMCLSFSAANADTLDFEVGIALRHAAMRGEIDTVENLLTEAQTRYEAGEIPADQLRILNAPFAFTHPDMVTFIENWRRERPASPYAKIAEVWLLNRVSWNIRGTKFAGQTYPEAIERFNNMQQRAWGLAHEVYRANPRMIPASDAVLRLANGTGHQRTAIRAFHATMAEDPNKGTLQRAIDIMVPGWGWQWSHVEEACDRYAGLVENPDPSPELTCKLRKAQRFDGERFHWMQDEIGKGKLPHLDHLRLHALIPAVGTREQAEHVHSILMEGRGTEDDRMNFDRHVAPRFDLAPVYGPLSHEAHDTALDQIEYDPYNIAALRVLSQPVMETRFKDNGKFSIKAVSRPSPEDRLEYARRILIASPYQSDNWQDFLTHARRVEKTISPKKLEPYRINAIVYDNHSARSLYGYMVDQLEYYDVLKTIERGEAPAGISEQFKEMDIETEVICPFVRTARLFELVCSYDNDHVCTPASHVEEAFAVIAKDAEARGICIRERDAPAQSLAYDPVPLGQFEALEGGG